MTIKKEALEIAKREGKATFELAPLKKAPPTLPATWKAALTHEEPTRAVLDVVWKPIAKLYPKTIAAMKKKLQHVGLLTTAKRGASIVYVFELEDDGGLFLRRGYLPASKLPKIATRLAKDFTAFYSVHDGWLDGYSMMGPRRSCDWAPLGVEGPSRDFLVTFEGHGPASLGFDLSEKDTPCFTIWNDDKPERNRKVAKAIDDWFAIRMEECEERRA